MPVAASEPSVDRQESFSNASDPQSVGPGRYIQQRWRSTRIPLLHIISLPVGPGFGRFSGWSRNIHRTRNGSSKGISTWKAMEAECWPARPVEEQYLPTVPNPKRKARASLLFKRGLNLRTRYMLTEVSLATYISREWGWDWGWMVYSSTKSCSTWQFCYGLKQVEWWTDGYVAPVPAPSRPPPSPPSPVSSIACE